MIIKKLLREFTGYKNDSVSLTIVGVGPGDPSLLTIAAVNAIKKAKVIVFPVSDENKKSFAAEIVKKYTKFKKNIPIIFPMARKDFDPDEIWFIAVEKIVKFIQNGESVLYRLSKLKNLFIIIFILLTLAMYPWQYKSFS